MKVAEYKPLNLVHLWSMISVSLSLLVGVNSHQFDVYSHVQAVTCKQPLMQTSSGRPHSLSI
jgi:hypothetical protein